MTDEADEAPPTPPAQPDTPPAAERNALRRKVIGWGAVAAVASAILALVANLSEVIGALQPDKTRELVEQTRSTLADTDQKVDELVMLLRNQAAVSGMSLDLESEAAIRNAVEAIVVSGNREKQAALQQVNDGDPAGAAASLEKLARSQGDAASATSDTAADSWAEAAALYDAVDLEKAVDCYAEAVSRRPGDAVLLDAYARALGRAGRQDDAHRHFEAVLELAPDGAVRSAALQGLGGIARQRGDYAEATLWLEQALDVAEASGDRAERIHALHSLALLRRSQGELVESNRLLGRAGELAEEAGDADLLALVQTAMGSNAATAEDYDGAVANLNAALDIYQSANNLPRQAIVVGNLGAVALKRGDLDEAESLLLDSVRIGETLKWQSSIAYDMVNLAMISGERKDYGDADERLGRAQSIAEQNGLTELLPVIVFNRGEIAETAGDLDGACQYYSQAAPMFIAMGSEHAALATERLDAAGCPGAQAID